MEAWPVRGGMQVTGHIDCIRPAPKGVHTSFLFCWGAAVVAVAACLVVLLCCAALFPSEGDAGLVRSLQHDGTGFHIV